MERFVSLLQPACLLVGLVCLSLSLPVLAWRCQGRIVDQGDPESRVASLCGPPDLSDSFIVRLHPGYGIARRVDVWYYNPGPASFVRRLRFINGRLQSIQTQGYGFSTLPRGRCDPDRLHAGMSEFELLVRCGKPARRNFNVPPGAYGLTAPVSPLRLQEWFYAPAGKRPGLDITLISGQVADIETKEGN